MISAPHLPFRVLHLIERLSLGGASRSLLATANHLARAGAVRHVVGSLLPPNTAALKAARTQSMDVRHIGDSGSFDDEVALADIVLIHFWNSPVMYDWLYRFWAPARIVCWCHVAGDTAPQILPAPMMQFADAVLAATPHTAELAVFRAAAPGILTGTVLDSPDFSRLAGASARGHSRFTVGYIGTVDFVKMHPDFIALHAALDIPDLRVVVAGHGTASSVLRKQAAKLGRAELFEFPGYVEDVGGLLSECDVFGYPLVADSYAATDLAVQEAMYAGVPPVIWAGAGPGCLVEHGRTGWMARSAEEYRAGIELLHRDAELRLRLGAGAARHARDALGAERSAAQLMDIYEHLLERPKRSRRWPEEAGSAAERFVLALGPAGTPFQESLRGAAEGDENKAAVAERVIAASSPSLASGASGGILHHRIHHPDDPHLRLWAGLSLAFQGRNALAAGEFAAALRLGLDTPRVRGYLAAVSGGPDINRLGYFSQQDA